jgi:glutamyl-tRNA synthetase
LTLDVGGRHPDPEVVRQAVPLVKERMPTVKEGAELLPFLFTDEIVPDDKARKMLEPDRADYLKEVASRLEGIEDWNPEEIERVLRALKEERGLSSNQAFQPIRAAVTGRLVSPPLFESLALLGREKTLARVRAPADTLGDP